MNKTVNINLGGMFFHIDEDAFQKLTRYFDAIKRSLTNSSGQDEIIKDIEMRIAEIITEKHTNEKQVINLKEVDDVIAIMGQPEDYRLEDDNSAGSANQSYAFANTTMKRKKLYRDTEKGMIGGVATGLGHYFGIDSIWIKILFLILVFAAFGTGIVAYLILWIITPAAVTTAEKLEMTGEPVNISNIERKVREEFDSVSERIKNANYDEMGRNVKTGFERSAGKIGDALLVVFKAFAKVLGAIIVVFAAVTLGSLIVGLLTLGSTSFVDMPWHDYADAVNYTDTPLWVVGILGFLAIGIPFFFLFILGLKLLVTNLKSMGGIVKYTLLALWLISVAILIALGVKQATEIAFDGKVVEKAPLSLQATDTLFIKFRFNDYYAKDIDHQHDYMFTQDADNKELIYSNDVEIHILTTDEKMAFIQIEKQAEGKSLSEAKKRAENIRYAYTIEGNQLVLDNYLLTETVNKYRNQQVQIFLYLPEGTVFKADSSMQEYDSSDDSFFNLHYSGDYIYKVQKNQVLCVDCPADENEFGDIDVTEDSLSTTVTINNDGILIKEGDSTANKQFKGLRINEDGIIIKTK